MAFKKVTTGIASIQSVVNEIVTFATVDLNSPWRNDGDVNPSSVSTGDFPTSSAARVLQLSKVPAQARVTGPNGAAFNSPYVGSPIPDRMFTYFTNNTIGVQLTGTVHDIAAAASPIVSFPPFPARDDGLVAQRNWNDNRTNIGVNAAEALNSVSTALYLFGPEQPLTSPKGQADDPNIPNYVYFVIEFDPGRFGHGFFGEWKKMVPFPGGAGNWGSHRDGSNTVDNSTNETAWNNAASGARGTAWYSCNGFWGNVYGTGDNGNGLSPRPIAMWCGDAPTSLMDNGFASIAGASRKMGHTIFRDFMTGPSRALLSGFQPMVTPYMMMGDWFFNSLNLNDPDQDWMPLVYPEDFFLSDITNFEPGVQIDVGGVPVIPFPITSKLGGTPSSTYGAYCYRVRT